MKAQRLSSRGIVGLVAALLALLLMAIPAIAESVDEAAPTTTTVPEFDGSDHDGDADSDPATAYTEDTDTNDGTANNVPDEGDNAHPSGKDRSVEPGGSGNQGQSESDPDDNGRGPDRTNGGADKPNGPGGVDKADQDGNNGCGNDDDFEDDNEGWCGKKPKNEEPPVEDCDEDMPGNQTDCDEDEVDDSKVTLCHATGSETNPFVMITIAAAGAYNGHLGADHQGEEDIIPPFEWQGETYSQNWDAAGQALYNKGCEEDVLGTTIVTPTTVPTTTTLPTTTTIPNVLGEVLTKDGGIGTKVNPKDKVLNELISNPKARKPLVKAAAREAGAPLPFTGSSVLMLLAFALGLLSIGLLSLESSVALHNAAVRKDRR